MTIPTIAAPQLMDLGVKSEVAFAYRVPGVDDSKRDEVDSYEAEWEASCPAAQGLLERHGLV